jgi:esterase/lipase superfamily enzyme
MKTNSCNHFVIVTTLIIWLQGCASSPALMPTPNVYSQARSYPAEQINEDYKNNHVEILYVTDRASTTRESGELVYGSDRSSSLAFGIAEAVIGDALAWDNLVELSASADRPNKLPFSMKSRIEVGRYPSTPYPFDIVNGHAQIQPNVVRDKEKQDNVLVQEITKRLTKSESKSVVVFIHGFNNSFDDAVYTLAGVWHFLGRQGVPIAYSWPAARGGLLGYFVDRESGEYTIYHLKELLRTLFSIPKIESINIIAHSRGTDVTTTALRELVIENNAKGLNLLEQFRIKNLILAAPDLDFGVISQRLMAEQFGAAFKQITIYTTQSDKALGFAQKLMSGVRFGRVRSADLTEDQRVIFSNVKNVHIIETNKTKGFVGHGYFHSNPAVSSDLVTLINSGATPGSLQRPLVRKQGNFWKIPENYPNPQE